MKDSSDVQNTQDHDARHDDRDGQIMLPGKLLLQEYPAPENGHDAIGADDRGGEGDMRRIGQRVNIEELADRLKNCAGEFRDLHLHHGFLLFDPVRIYGGKNAHEQERQLIRDVGGILHQLLAVPEQKAEGRLIRNRVVKQDKAVRKGPERVQKTVNNRNEDRDEALRVMIVGRVLPFLSQILILPRFHNAETDHAGADERDRDKCGGRQFIADAEHQEREDRNDRPGTVADWGRDGQLDIPESQIPDRHGNDIQKGNGQIGQNDLYTDLHAVEKNLVAGVQAHDDADGGNHLQMTVFIGSVTASDLGEQVGTAPADERDNSKPEPHDLWTSEL